MSYPEFDIEQMDRRFVHELARLHEIGQFDTYSDLMEQMGLERGFVTRIEKGRYHVNVRLLYQVKVLCPQLDLEWVVMGAPATGRAEPTGWPERQVGRPIRA
ncbi:hypothetical protein SAMN06265337_0673 [Hymenobacter gelipurpurascens]|uniref:HTH cro/C1-type domain-containing protein n=1 Tax=Hymenobacter gelipurpurascens TaxID=89968 RepID=A0A212T9H6_9BACT|nr:hypothetical protein [Hymenobacter gelipurpurascens]SNC62454.1 hypothetical protein SAMN06265337_0673 [Hymenobacter gelipurpurascens]